jgi:heat shock protein HslJ
MRRRSLFVLVLCTGLLAACSTTTQPAAPISSGDPDLPTSSDMVTPVGGDLRIGETWYLTWAAGDSPRAGADVTMTFEDESVGGQAPVNTYSAGYTTTSSGAIELGPIASTLMAGEPDAMQAEAEFFALLEAVDGYTTVSAGEMYLFDGDLQTMAFSLTPGVPDDPTISEEAEALAASVIGLTEAEAQRTVEEAGYSFRVVSRDGVGLAITEDYSVTRINVSVVADRVTDSYVG